MRKVANAINLKDNKKQPFLNVPNRADHLSLLNEISDGPSSYNLRNFFIYPQNAFLFILLVPLIRLLPFPEEQRALPDSYRSIQKEIFSKEALKAIQQKCEEKVTSKPLIQTKELLKHMKEELDEQAKVSTSDK